LVSGLDEWIVPTSRTGVLDKHVSDSVVVFWTSPYCMTKLEYLFTVGCLFMLLT